MTCKVDECERPVTVRREQLCRAHNDQRIKGLPFGPAPSRRIRGVTKCRIEGCDRPYRCTGYCGLHYSRYRTHGHHDLPERLAPETTCPSCGERKDYRAQYCQPCWGKSRRGVYRGSGRYTNQQGYVVVSGQWEHPNQSSRGAVYEHVLVMAEHLGRGLVKGENVHHINGVRDDNRLENLELWSASQPPGQRIADKVEWAKELLSLYEPEALTQPRLRLVDELAS